MSINFIKSFYKRLLLNSRNKDGDGLSIIFGILLVLSTLICIPTPLLAQQDYNQWLKEQEEEFSNFIEKRDREFIAFLKKEWKEYQFFQALSPDKIPKPLQVPRIRPSRQLKKGIDNGKIIKDFKVEPPPQHESIDVLEGMIMKFFKGERLDFSYLNTPCSVYYDKGLKDIILPDQLNSNYISRFWEQLVKIKYKYLLKEVLEAKNKMKLNDWGYYRFLMNMSSNIYPENYNKMVLLVWFLMQKSGYDVKVGYSSDNINLLIMAKNLLYGFSYIENNNGKYYKVDSQDTAFKEDIIYTYQGTYPDAVNKIDFNIHFSPVCNSQIDKKNICFNYNTKVYTLPLEINSTIIEFYKDYPMTEYEIYFNAPISPETGYSLLRSLKPLLVGKTEVEGVNLLLHFVQKGFQYKADVEQFGREKPFFPEETLFYPSSDCEDRSVLFAYLIRKLISKKVVGLNYPGHIATAVKFFEDISGEYIIFKGEKYFICDPTFINAKVGQCMPKYKNIDPQIISLNDPD